MQDALEVRIAHADVVHMVERVADVVDARAADADALGDEARAAVKVELAHVGGMRRVGNECKRPHGFPGSDPDRDQARLVDPARHLAVPEPRERAAQARGVNSVGDAPAGAAAAKAHDETGLALSAAIARRQDAERAVVPVRAAERFLPVLEARRPHERAIAEHPEVAFGQQRLELAEGHPARNI